GNLDAFLTDELFKKYKKIFVRGHLTLYKNEKEINAMYRKSKKFDYVKIFESEECYLFDEWMGIHKIFNEFNIETYHEEIVADINAKSARFICTNIQNYHRQIFVWSPGSVRQHYIVDDVATHSKELAYIH